MTELSNQTLVHLSVIGTMMTLEARRTAVFEECVFSRDSSETADKKLRRFYARTLRGELAHKVLMIVWKESNYISNFELNISGDEKQFTNNDLTVHRLAVLLADQPNEVSALNTSIRNIAIASHAFGLIERSHVFSKKAIIKGTIILHELMVRLATEYEIVISSTFAQLHSGTEKSQTN